MSDVSIRTASALQAADLAEKSTERAVRVAACEFMHASILWMVGTNARRYNLQEPLQLLRPVLQAPHIAHSISYRRALHSVFIPEVPCAMSLLWLQQL